MHGCPHFKPFQGLFVVCKGELVAMHGSVVSTPAREKQTKPPEVPVGFGGVDNTPIGVHIILTGIDMLARLRAVQLHLLKGSSAVIEELSTVVLCVVEVVADEVVGIDGFAEVLVPVPWKSYRFGDLRGQGIPSGLRSQGSANRGCPLLALGGGASLGGPGISIGRHSHGSANRGSPLLVL